MSGPEAPRRRTRFSSLELRALAVQSREILLLAAVTGAFTGLGVAVFDRFTGAVVFQAVLRAPRWVQVGAPLLGFAAAALALRFIAGGATPSTADEYVKAMTARTGSFALRPLIGRMVAAVATLGTGGAMGYEGPSLYLGAGIGVALRQRFRRLFSGVDPHVALVAGAAAGVAAIFKAPATGAVFALEVPFHDDLARRALMPALIGAASGYLTFVAVNGTNPLIPISGQPPIGGRELAGAALVGLLCGLGARAFAVVVRAAKRIASTAAWWRPLLAGVASGGLVVASINLFHGEVLTLGPGYRSIGWSLDPKRALWLIALLATARVAATATAIAGGGVGGLFVPLVVQGALSGRLVAGMVGGHDQSLYVVLGIAAFLGAGYRVPLAAVMFVAEATGRPGFVVPGLIAAVVGQLIMGSESVSAYQGRLRSGYLEDRARLPVTAAIRPPGPTAVPGDTLADVYAGRSSSDLRMVPVTDNGAYVGVVLLDDLLAQPPSSWHNVRVAAVMRSDGPVGAPDWTLRRALAAMTGGGVDRLPIVDSSGQLLGLVTYDSLLRLEPFLDETEE